MPFIDCKIAKKLTDKEKDLLTKELGKAITCMNKTESYLMVGISDGYKLYFGGKEIADGAFIQVNVFGTVKADNSEKMTKAVCDILKANFGIAESKVYVTYGGVENWGWNGTNF
jgi:phenylpyruvate tautomerase PptA (4-oxalocrotonate tautomerase family)